MVTDAPPGEATRVDRRLVPVLVFLGIVTTAVGSLGAPLLPSIAAADHVSVADSQWALTISLLVGAVASPVLGRVGDGERRRTVLLAAVFVVTVGCAVSALPTGFAGLLAGRALQGVGLGLIPLAMATARDALPAARSGPTIALLGVTTSAGIGVGYPAAGLLTQYVGLPAAFWAGAATSAVALIAAALVLPSGPPRPAQPVDATGALLLGGGVVCLLLALAEGGQWGWTSARVLGLIGAAALLLAGWVRRELSARAPLVDVRALRHPSVLAANTTVLLVGIGIYPLLSLVVRLVETPTSTGYGFGASVTVAGLMLVPFSLASFAASRVIAPALRRTTPEVVVALSCLVMLAAMVLFWVARDHLVELLVTMALAGFGVGCVFAANPLQIVRGVPAAQTGSALGFYQVLRALAFTVGSVLSATVLVASTPAGRSTPTTGGYDSAAVLGIAVLVVAVVLATVLSRRAPG